MNFKENANFDKSNIENLKLDFYNYFYLISKIPPEKIGEGVHTSIKNDILVSIKLLFEIKLDNNDEKFFDIMDKTTTTYAKIVYFFGDFTDEDKKSDYIEFISGFKSYVLDVINITRMNEKL